MDYVDELTSGRTPLVKKAAKKMCIRDRVEVVNLEFQKDSG